MERVDPDEGVGDAVGPADGAQAFVAGEVEAEAVGDSAEDTGGVVARGVAEHEDDGGGGDAEHTDRPKRHAFEFMLEHRRLFVGFLGDLRAHELVADDRKILRDLDEADVGVFAE